MTLLLGVELGVIGTLGLVLLIGRLAMRRLVIPSTPPISAANTKLRLPESAVAVLNAGDPTRRRTISSQPPEIPPC